MKKLVFVLGVIFLLLAGCETKLYSVLIKNESSKTVKYTYNGLSRELAPTGSEAYEVKAYTLPPTDIKDEYGIASIEMVRSGDIFTFEPAPELHLYVKNTLSIPIEIKADNYIDEGGSVKFEIGVNEEKTTAKIYTNKPNFSLIADDPSYPIIIDWYINGDTMYVIIR